MQQIETAWRNWLLQFAPYVFSSGDLIQDPREELFPRITYSYGITEALENGLMTVILWDKSFNDTRIWEMHNKIDIAVPALSGTALIIATKPYYEYFNPDIGEWERFDLSEFNNIADRLSPNTVEWRKVEGGNKQDINIWRDTTYSQPYPQEEQHIRARLIRLHIRNRTSI